MRKHSKRKVPEPYPAPPVGLEEFINLQEVMIAYEENNTRETVQFIVGSKFAKTEEGIVCITEEILHMVAIRPKREGLYVTLFDQLVNSANSSNKLSLLKKTIVEYALKPGPEYTVFQRIPHYHFARLLFLKNHIDIENIINLLIDYPQNASSQFLFIVYFFAPELSSSSRRQFGLFQDRINAAEYPEKIVKEAYDMNKSFQRNDWELLRGYINYGSPIGSLQYILKYDDVEGLKKLEEKDPSIITTKIHHNMFEPCLFVQWDPLPVEYAAFFSSYNCFKYLSRRGATSDYIAMYATAGGDVKILKLLAKHKVIWDSTPRIAAAFRRADILEWILERRSEALNRRRELNYALCRAAEANDIQMIIGALQAGASLTFKDENAQTPLLSAATGHCFEAAEYLIRYKDTDPDTKSAFGRSIADETRDPRIAKLVVDESARRAAIRHAEEEDL